MKTINTGILVIGAGPAGLAAAIQLQELSADVLLVDRENETGGVLNQCIHNGFGLEIYKKELTGPEYAQFESDKARQLGVRIETGLSILRLVQNNQGFVCLATGRKTGLVQIQADAVILAMGCRERTRGNIKLPGSRPAGVMTAGLAQRLVNREGLMPGKEIVILGSGDIGLIMARRMSLEGAIVRAVVEIQPYPNGLARNITQCLDDFSIPLYLSHTVCEIRGDSRISSVMVRPVQSDRPPFEIGCDTLLLSVGLIPENELSMQSGVQLHPVTRGPLVDSAYMTNVPGIFACGNVLHVHDLADKVTQEARLAAINCHNWLKGSAAHPQTVAVQAGKNIRYVLPCSANPSQDTELKFRVMMPMVSGQIRIMQGGTELMRKKIPALHPSQMESLILKKNLTQAPGAITVDMGESA